MTKNKLKRHKSCFYLNFPRMYLLFTKSPKKINHIFHLHIPALQKSPMQLTFFCDYPVINRIKKLHLKSFIAKPVLLAENKHLKDSTNEFLLTTPSRKKLANFRVNESKRPTKTWKLCNVIMPCSDVNYLDRFRYFVRTILAMVQ